MYVTVVLMGEGDLSLLQCLPPMSMIWLALALVIFASFLTTSPFPHLSLLVTLSSLHLGWISRSYHVHKMMRVH